MSLIYLHWWWFWLQNLLLALLINHSVPRLLFFWRLGSNVEWHLNNIVHFSIFILRYLWNLTSWWWNMTFSNRYSISPLSLNISFWLELRFGVLSHLDESNHKGKCEHKECQSTNDHGICESSFFNNHCFNWSNWLLNISIQYNWYLRCNQLWTSLFQIGGVWNSNACSLVLIRLGSWSTSHTSSVVFYNTVLTWIGRAGGTLFLRSSEWRTYLAATSIIWDSLPPLASQIYRDTNLVLCWSKVGWACSTLVANSHFIISTYYLDYYIWGRWLLLNCFHNLCNWCWSWLFLRFRCRSWLSILLPNNSLPFTLCSHLWVILTVSTHWITSLSFWTFFTVSFDSQNLASLTCIWSTSSVLVLSSCVLGTFEAILTILRQDWSFTACNWVYSLDRCCGQ